MNAELVERLKHSLRQVSPFSQTVQAALAKMDEKPVDINAVGQLLEMDPVLTASILKLANSPFYGFAREISKVTDALVLLGVHNLRQLVVSFSLIKNLSTPNNSGIDRNALWQHSIAVAVAAKLIAQQSGHNEDSAFVAGMLHDLGLLILDQCLGDDYQPVIAYRDQHQCPLVVAEKAVLDINHGVVGAAAISKWNLPLEYCEVALRCDQTLVEPPKIPLVDVVHLANQVVKGLWIAPAQDSVMVNLAPQTLKRLNLTWHQLETLLPQIESSSREVITRILG